MATADQHLDRVRRLCLALPETSERESHGMPTFFGPKKVFTMFADNHHNDGRLAVWLPAPPGAQEALIAEDPLTFFRPPYVGPSGWAGLILDRVTDEDLAFHIEQAWRLTVPKRLLEAR